MSILIAIAIFVAIWYILHKILIWHTARPKTLFRASSVYNDPAENITLDSRSIEE